MLFINSLEDLESIYGSPAELSVIKVLDRVTPLYRRFIEASPFVVLATCGPEGLDCSPRGDGAGFIRIHNERILMMPDRRGNNRLDSLRNIVRDPRVALLFLAPGSGTTIRVNGRAKLSIDAELLASFAVDGKEPRSVIVIEIDELYFQCARAIVRADLWNAEKHLEPKNLPSAGALLAEASCNRVGGEAYDREWPERAMKTLW